MSSSTTTPEMKLGFYDDLPQFEGFIGITSAEHYFAAPDSWLLVITDVVGSTRAIEDGRYKDVNAVGVACIVAAKNALGDGEFPYVFGGDGATLLIPETTLAKVTQALLGVAHNAESAFALKLRLGVVSVGELRRDGFDLNVARFRASAHASFAMFSGSALAEAERRVKSPELGARYALTGTLLQPADLSGLECRWRPIPSQHGQVVSLLVQARTADAHTNAALYRHVLDGLARLTHGLDQTVPVSSQRLRLGLGGGKLDQEARLFSSASFGLGYWKQRCRVLLFTLIGLYLFLTGRRLGSFDGKTYRDEIVGNSDFRKFDGTLRLVLDLTPAQVTALREFLEIERQAGKLAFGIHTANASLMTCVISSYAGNHVHFIDGAEGGYALAAKELKAQLKSDA